MKTLHITNCWHSESGGIATFYRALLAGAESAQRPVRLVVPGSRDRIEESGSYGRIYHVEARQSRLSPGYRVITPAHYLLPRSPLRRIIASERPDLVECCDKYTLNYLGAVLRRRWLLGRQYRPAIIGLSCERMDDNVVRYVSTSPLVKSLCRVYMKWLYFPMFDHHIVVSQHAAGELRDASRGHSIRRGVWVRSMGADCDLFRPERRRGATRHWLRALTGAADDVTLLLYAGRLAPEKNLELLVDTMCVLEQQAAGRFHLLVAGEGPLRAWLERECDRRVPGAVRFIGHIGQREVLADIYANCDIFVHPNPREPFGIAPVEALASGLAMIGPSSGGLMSYADASNAWLVEPDAGSFARAVRSVREQPEIASARRRQGRLTAERFDWKCVIPDFLKLYDELHALVEGRRPEPLLSPAFYSTTGNRFGWETGQ